MTTFHAPAFALIQHWPKGLVTNVTLLSLSAFFSVAAASVSQAAPVILNQPFTAKPGDVIALTGSGFGSSPKVIFKTRRQGSQITVKTIRANDISVEIQIPPSQPFDVYDIAISDGQTTSAYVPVNLPQPMHFDVPEAASSDKFRIFGRNLYVPPATPTVRLLDPSSNTSLTASVDTSTSDAFSLTVIAPPGIVPGRAYKAAVSNGYGENVSNDSITGRSGDGTDYFQLGVPWGRDYVYKNGPNYNGTADNADHRVYNVKTDPFLKVKAKGDGVSDDQPAIQAAINAAASHGGGLVYLPAGTYRLISSTYSNGFMMASKVVVQGEGAGRTTILYGPTSQQSSSYSLKGAWFPPGTTASGFADLSFKNLDTLSQNVLGVLIGGTSYSSKIFLKRVNWDFGTGRGFQTDSADRLVIADSTFRHPINKQFPNSSCPDSSGIGPFGLYNVTNLRFSNNTVWWASGGGATIKPALNSVIEGNRFTRSASDKITVTSQNISCLNVDKTYQPLTVGGLAQRQMGRQIVVEFGKNVVVQNNIFDVSDGTLMHNWYDGETINSEAGGPKPKMDSGSATSATSTTIADDSRNGSWNYESGYKIAIVSGRGRGQWRNIVSRNNNTFTVDMPWTIVPAAGDHFSIFLPTLENSIIRGNQASNNPSGILLYQGSALNVAIANNRLTDNGGIFLFPKQMPASSTRIMGVMRNIEITGNILTNTKSLFPSWIAVTSCINSPNNFWGTAMDGIEVRSNSITARSGTPPYIWPEGYRNFTLWAVPGADFGSGSVANPIIGTILQNNSCNNCPASFVLNTGAYNTVIWNATVNGVLQRQYAGLPFIQDEVIRKPVTQKSIGTTVGAD